MLTWRILAFVLAFSGLSASSSVQLKDGTDELDLKDRVEIYHDKDKDLKIEDILKPEIEKRFQLNQRASLNLGYTNDNVWARVSLENKGSNSQKRFIKISYPPLDYVHFYQVNGGQVVQNFTTGDKVEFAKRPVQHRHFVFPVVVAAGERSDIYFMFDTQTSVQFPMTLLTEEGFRHTDRNEQYVLGVYYGIMVAMILFNIFIFFFIRDQNYLWYVVYITSFLFFVLNLNGIAYELLWPQSPEWNSISLVFFGNLFILTILNFTIQFLNIRNLAPRLFKFCLALMGLYGLNGILMFIFPGSFFGQFTNVSGFFNVVLCIGIGIFAWRKGFTPARYFILAFSAFQVFGIFWILSRFGIIPRFFLSEYGMQVGSAIEALLLSFALGDRFNELKNAKEKSDREKLEGRLKLLESFSRFVPGQFIKTLEKSSVEEIEAGEVREKTMTVLFCDIRRFTALSESMSAEDNLRFINSYFRRMTPIIQEHNGFIDKFIGDAIMALFTSAEDAVKASLGMIKELATYNQHRASQGYVAIDIGIGLNTGRMVLGTVGTDKRLDTTVIGDSVNTASRVEPLNKLYGTRLIVTESVVSALPENHGFLFRQVDNIIVRGKNKPTKIFECYDLNDEALRAAKESSLENFNRALAFYADGKFEEAADILGNLVADQPDDKVAGMYHRRCQKLMAQPPGEGWQGISKMR